MTTQALPTVILETDDVYPRESALFHARDLQKPCEFGPSALKLLSLEQNFPIKPNPSFYSYCTGGPLSPGGPEGP